MYICLYINTHTQIHIKYPYIVIHIAARVCVDIMVILENKILQDSYSSLCDSFQRKKQNLIQINYILFIKISVW